MKAIQSLFILGVVAAATIIQADLASCSPSRGDTNLESRATLSGIKPSFNVSSCPGYRIAGKVRKYKSGFTLPLKLAGEACHAFGVDIVDLTLSVVYEKKHQLHVHIYDTAKNQFQLPLDLIMNRPSSDPSEIHNGSTAEESDLEFHHTAEEGYHDSKSSSSSSSSWAFWITRKNSSADPIFDTRPENIPTYDYPFNSSAVNTERNTTAMPNHNMIFENQYLQLSSALPVNANLYGLGERYNQGGIGGSTWRVNPNGTLQPFWTLDAGDPLSSNMYGYHPVYLEARQQANDSKVQSHVVAYQNTAGLDIITRPKLIQYRAIGGTLDFRFMSGNEASSSSVQEQQEEDKETVNGPNTAIEQYVQYINLPLMIPRWSLGFHMLRWGFSNTSQARQAHQHMLDANIPLEVLWSDIDYLHSFRDFTIDPNSYGDYPEFINNLTALGQRWIPIVDTAIPATPQNASDIYDPGTRGSELDVFIKNDNGTDYIGIVWPGPAKFMDTHAVNAQKWWNEAFANFTQLANFSGIWLDMSEPSSFIVGSAVNPNNLSASDSEYVGATSVGGWPEGYCNQTWGSSGNMTIKGQSTFSTSCLTSAEQEKRSHFIETMPNIQEVLPRSHVRDMLYEARQVANDNSSSDGDFHYSPAHYEYQNVTSRVLYEPPYAIHNGIMSSEGPLVDNLNKKTVAVDSITNLGKFYDVHNIYGTMLGLRTHQALQSVRPDERAFVVARSTYPGAGKYMSHWLGDNYSKWQYMAKSLEGLLQFQLFGIPSVGPDICGFNGNSDEELCNRWMMLGAFAPFMRNHNTQGAISQEPYIWPSVTNASRIAIHKRYELLPEIYSLRARSSQRGTPMVKSLWYEFPDQFDVLSTTDSQYMLGPSLLVSPVLEPNVDTVKAYFPQAGGKWRNIFTYEELNVTANVNTSISAPLSTINVHMRPGRAILTHMQAKYTIAETSNTPFSLWINLNNKGKAKGDAYMDDGISLTPTPSSELTFTVCNKKLSGTSNGNHTISQRLDNVILMGIDKKPSTITTSDGRNLFNSSVFERTKNLLNISNVDVNLNSKWSISWS